MRIYSEGQRPWWQLRYRNGDRPLAGKVDGQKIAWSYDSEYEGSPLTVKFSGTIDSAATKLAGSVSVEQFGVDGDFTGVPSK